MDYRFTILVVSDCLRQTIRFAGNVSGLQSLCADLKRRYNPRYMEVSDRKSNRTMRFEF